ncbi:MAG: 50S ribosomal protein L31 [Fusobacteria bacterium]|nr:50S ribosomal protein L31 [Fusobacteriota bacterium]
MKKNIHPAYNLIKVECSCGSHFETRTTYKKAAIFKTAICSNCHPFYTGKSKFVDETGRVEKFKQRYAAAATTAKK